MSFTEKVDVLDLLINVLKEHEQKLDEITTRLEEAAPKKTKLNPAPVAHTEQGQEGQGMNHPEPSIILVRTENERQIVTHLIREVYATAPRMIENTGIAEATLYYSLKQLKKRGVVDVAGSVSNKNGGPAVKIWKLKGGT